MYRLVDDPSNVYTESEFQGRRGCGAGESVLFEVPQVILMCSHG